MKPHIKRLWAAFAGVVVALTVTPALVAHAADTGPDFDTVSATGTTTFAPPIQPVGGSGTWNFVSSGPCAELSGGIEVSTSEIVESGATCTITGNGTYANVVCMQAMTISGVFSVSITVTVPFVATETWSTSFSAVITGGSGPINGTSVEGATSDGDNDGGRAWTTTGQLSYTPTAGNCVTGVSAAFTSLSLNVAEQTT